MLVKVENKRKCVLAKHAEEACIYAEGFVWERVCVETNIPFTFFSCYFVFSVVLTKKIIWILQSGIS